MKITYGNNDLIFILIAFFVVLLPGCDPKWTEVVVGPINIITNEGGRTLGYSDSSGVQILTVDRLAFKAL